jgi:flagellar biosynthesis protein FlhB
MADSNQKTEQPTERRKLKAREDGNYPSARQFISGVQFCVFVGLVESHGGEWMEGTARATRAVVKRAFDPNLSAPLVMRMSIDLMWRCLLPLLIGGALLVLLTLGLQMAVTRMGFSAKKIAPDFNRLNPASRIKQLPGQNMQSLMQAVILLPLFGAAIYIVASDHMDAFRMLPLASLGSGLHMVSDSVSGLLWKAAALFFIFGCVDLTREMRRHTSQLKMSRQEIKDEMKESEGNPQVKAKIRAIRRDQARRRMMQAVPTATAVVVNPTHFAVALLYTPDSMMAPLVVAKGKNYLALRIKQKAIDNQVPIIENPPLAQALYKSVDVGQEIPPQLYRAVAELLAYIFKTMRRR